MFDSASLPLLVCKLRQTFREETWTQSSSCRRARHPEPPNDIAARRPPSWPHQLPVTSRFGYGFRSSPQKNGAMSRQNWNWCCVKFTTMALWARACVAEVVVAEVVFVGRRPLRRLCRMWRRCCRWLQVAVIAADGHVSRKQSMQLLSNVQLQRQRRQRRSAVSRCHVIDCISCSAPPCEWAAHRATAVAVVRRCCCCWCSW